MQCGAAERHPAIECQNTPFELREDALVQPVCEEAGLLWITSLDAESALLDLKNGHRRNIQEVSRYGL